MSENKIILDTSDEAAKQITVTGWVSRDGIFYGEHGEEAARYRGCTHRICECGAVMEKSYTKCKDCRRRAEYKHYISLPAIEWDGKTPLCIYGTDQYFFDGDELDEYCEDSETEYTKLMLMICEPGRFREIDPYDCYVDDLCDDGELPQDILDAFAELNERITEHKKPAYWSQGKQRVLIDGKGYEDGE